MEQNAHQHELGGSSPDRVIAIGDIHGCSQALAALIHEIDPQPADTIVTLGDYIDRGPDSYGVVEQILALSHRCEVVHLLGNHELMLLIARSNPAQQRTWEMVGGAATVLSYRDAARDGRSDSEPMQTVTEPGSYAVEDATDSLFDLIPSRHLDFFDACSLAYETDTHIFVHANYEPDQPIGEQNEEVLLWRHLAPNAVPNPHVSGKKVIVGHTPQIGGEVLDLGHLVCIDTYCFGSGWLTALEVHSGDVWQANTRGQVRVSTEKSR